VSSADIYLDSRIFRCETVNAQDTCFKSILDCTHIQILKEWLDDERLVLLGREAADGLFYELKVGDSELLGF
jgi:hypothetical protein